MSDVTETTGAPTIGEIGEFELIERIRAAARGHVGDRVRIGIGDDAAVLAPEPGFEIVVSTDACVEGVHFRFATRAPEVVGHDALVANLSDLAAMGARPIAFTCAIQAPADLPLARFDGVVQGLAEAGTRYGTPLVGGNLSRARELSLSITVMGEVERGRALLRSGLAPGDRLFVTGRFGEAAANLARSERLGEPMRLGHGPRLEAGRALVASGLCSACIDCSDGLAADLAHLLEASSVGADVDASAVPRAEGLEALARRLGLEADALCFAGGEDYELIFGLRPPAAGLPAAAALGRSLGVMVTEIGSVAETPGLRGLPPRRGHTHFGSATKAGVARASDAPREPGAGPPEPPRNT